ncbi:hypothetical protein PROFUN_04890 [Planoprotostelium fungivorum]|uniref:Transmembrane protein n=1 Tax=Planoprotostelium fungivorum TaxID=1890364 RepID=A0A2P6NF80_9EUKA|nr:hypothetical protein PROFUN_04890 [Planoprotostelium fungivorum]
MTTVVHQAGPGYVQPAPVYGQPMGYPPQPMYAAPPVAYVQPTTTVYTAGYPGAHGHPGPHGYPGPHGHDNRQTEAVLLEVDHRACASLSCNHSAAKQFHRYLRSADTTTHFELTQNESNTMSIHKIMSKISIPGRSERKRTRSDVRWNMSPQESRNIIVSVESQIHYMELTRREDVLIPAGTMMDWGLSLRPTTPEPGRDHYPMCIVFTPLPLLSWLIPFIGHLGIGTTEGVINDFGGSYYIHKHKTATVFGSVTKYYPIKSTQLKRPQDTEQSVYEVIDLSLSSLILYQMYDAAVERASCDFQDQEHNIIMNNCHAHVASALNELQFEGFTHWNTLFLIIYMILFGRFVSFNRFLKSYALATIIVIVIIVLSVMKDKY